MLIILGIIYLATGGHSNLDFHSSFFPDLTNFDNVVLAASIFLFYAGMEMGGIHVKDIENPSRIIRKQYLSVQLSQLSFSYWVLSHWVLSFPKDISLTQSLLVGFDNYFKVHPCFLVITDHRYCSCIRCAGRCIDLGCRSVKGIFAVGKAGYMPPFFQKTNKLGVQKNILFITRWCCNSIEPLVRINAFRTELLSDPVTVDSSSLPYHVTMLMFTGAIVLRYKMKKLNRPFRIGKGGNGLMWFIGGLGFCGSLLAFILSFIPPSQISTGSNTVWFSVLIISAIVVVAAPFIIYACKETDLG